MATPTQFSAIPETYADQIGGIYFSGMTVRIELVSFPPGATGDQKRAEPEVRHVVVLPADGFLKSFRSLQAMMDKLGRLGSSANGKRKRPARL